jgi:hypothetical protein
VGVTREPVPDNDLGTYGYKRPSDTKRVPLNFKVPGSLKKRLEGLMRLWKARALVDDEDPDEITLTYVLENILPSAIDATWADDMKEVGMDHPGMPRDEQEWEELLALLKKRAKETRRQ